MGIREVKKCTYYQGVCQHGTLLCLLGSAACITSHGETPCSLGVAVTTISPAGQRSCPVVRLLHGSVRGIHLGGWGELQERGAVVQGIGVNRGVGHTREVQAQLLDERPFVVHSPLGDVLPLACLGVALHDRLDKSRPARKAAGGRSVAREAHVRAGEDIRHGALVPIVVVALAHAVRDVDADVRKRSHLRVDCLPQGLLADDPPSP
mmetsp:Transcript_46102/g.144628  ORF Transcript_46102/g.144628 Transcript_46102/m.144628 type:complete len:207 (+) Transcript_46102:82-702(+)